MPKNERKISYEGSEFQVRRTYPVLELAKQKNPMSTRGSDPTLNPFYQPVFDSLDDGYGRNVRAETPEDFHKALRGIEAAKKALDRAAKDDGETGVGVEVRFSWDENADELLKLPKETVTVPKEKGEGSRTVTRVQYPGEPVVISFYAQPSKPRKKRSKKDSNGETTSVTVATFQQGDAPDPHGNEV